jgi:hypothetical protein
MLPAPCSPTRKPWRPGAQAPPRSSDHHLRSLFRLSSILGSADPLEPQALTPGFCQSRRHASPQRSKGGTRSPRRTRRRIA